MSDGGFDGPGGFDDDMDAPDFGSSGDGMTASDTGDLALVAEPRKVEKISIDYARHAKRVNVKQLKRSMWDELTTSEVRAELRDETKRPRDNLHITHSLLSRTITQIISSLSHYHTHTPRCRTTKNTTFATLFSSFSPSGSLICSSHNPAFAACIHL